MPIHFLDYNSYLGFQEAVSESGIESTHIAQIALERRPIRAFIKVYPYQFEQRGEAREHRGIINEIIGYVLAEEVGLCVPDNGGLIFLRPDQIPKTVRIPKYPTLVRSGNDRYIAAWWVQDAFYPSLKISYNYSEINRISTSLGRKILHKIKNEILNSSETPLIIAFDDLIANIDRNIGNLLRVKSGQYILIDHGQILGRVDWVAKDLDPTKRFKNTIRNLIRPYSEQLPFSQKVVAESEKQSVYIRKNGLSTLLELMESLLDPEEWEALAHFIRKRSEHESIIRRAGLLI